tara:strand:- start:7122 stop:8642 length:1521 start_codon:yes stop_codon:yes gene_type:complete
MYSFIHDLVKNSAKSFPKKDALISKNLVIDYSELWSKIQEYRLIIEKYEIFPGERVAIYLPKNTDAVIFTFSISLVGAIFVPINPTLKKRQIEFIIDDCSASLIISSKLYKDNLSFITENKKNIDIIFFEDLKKEREESSDYLNKKNDEISSNSIAAILYTSGSTGPPKGVMISHKNFLDGAKTVSEYLELTENERVLSVLPLSFDYGFNQITSSFFVGSTVILSNYLLPMGLINQIEKYKITGLALVPHIWHQISNLNNLGNSLKTLKFVTNSGGELNQKSINKFRMCLPKLKIFLMYGFTEAFRSTFLDPSMVDRYPNSIGKAVRGVKIHIINKKGVECKPYEIGELLHEGAFVTDGYWSERNNLEEKCAPASIDQKITQRSVWSGDLVYKNNEGFLFFKGRKDDMIKTAGYRVSPSEIENIVCELQNVTEAVAFGVPHSLIGQGIILLLAGNCSSLDVHQHCLNNLPNYMIPKYIQVYDCLPESPNGKIDRVKLLQEFKDYFK